MTLVVRLLSRRLSRPAWLSGLVLVALVCLVTCATRLTTTDLDQLFTATSRLAGGHLSGLYPSRVGSTSGPGFALAAALPYRVAHLWWSPLTSYQRVSMLACPAAGVAMVRAGRAFGVPRRSASELLLAGTGCASPLVTNALTGEFHPQDILGAAWLLLALASAAERRWSRAGLFFALGLLTRQWMVLAILPTLAWAPPGRSRRQLALVTGLGSAAMLGPFVLTNGRGLVSALGAGPFHANMLDLWPLLPGGAALAGLLARVGPVLAAAGIAMFLGRRWRNTSRPVESLAWSVAAALACRMVFDTFFPYYLAPAVLVFAVADGSRPDRRGLAAAGLSVVYAVLGLVPSIPPLGTDVLGLAYLVSYLTVVFAALTWAGRRPDAAPMGPGWGPGSLALRPSASGCVP